MNRKHRDIEHRVVAALPALSGELATASSLSVAAEAAFLALREPFDLQTLGFSFVPRHTQTFRAEYAIGHPIEPDQDYLVSGKVAPSVIPRALELLLAEHVGKVNTWHGVFGPSDDLKAEALEMYQHWRQADAGMFVTTSNTAELYSNVAVHRAGEDFSDDEQKAFGHVAPLLHVVSRSLILQEQAELILAGANELATSHDKLLLLLDETLKLEWASPDYRQRLEPFWGVWDAALPPDLIEWLCSLPRQEASRHFGPGLWEKIFRARRGAARLRATSTRSSSGRRGLLVEVTVRDPSEQNARLRALGLTPREIDVVSLIPSGSTNQEIAHALGIREVTVKKHLRSVGDKFGVRGKLAILGYLTKTLNHPDWYDPEGI